MLLLGVVYVAYIFLIFHDFHGAFSHAKLGVMFGYMSKEGYIRIYRMSISSSIY